MAIKSPVQGSRVVPPSSPQGRLQREIHSIQRRCQETLRRAKARKVEMEQEEARRRIKMEGFRADIEENKRLREEAKLKEEERKRKEEKKLRLEMKKDVEKMIKGVEEARKDFKKLFKPTMVPRVHVAAVSNADSASLLSSVTQNARVSLPVPVPVPVMIHYQGEKKAFVVPVPGVSHQAACAPVPVPIVRDSQGQKKERKNMKTLSNAEIEAAEPVRVMNTQNDEGRVFQELDLDVICRGENKQVSDLKMKVSQGSQNDERDASQELNLDSRQGVEKKNKEREEQQKMKHVFASTISQSDFMHHKGEKKQVKVKMGDSVRVAPKPVTENLVNKPVIENNERRILNIKIKDDAKENEEKKILKEVTSIGIKGKHAALSLKKIKSNVGLKNPKPNKAAAGDDKKKKEIKEGKKAMFQSESLPSVFMHHKSFLEENDDSFDAFLESFNAPKWADLHNLNDYVEDNIEFFFQSGCSQNLLP